MQFFQEYLGMRTEYVDMTEFVRRMEEEIYDAAEFEKALAWVKENCMEGPDNNPADIQTTREQKDKDWETVVKMTHNRPRSDGRQSASCRAWLRRGSDGHNAIVSGFQGQRQWTDHFPNGDFMEAILNSSFDWNGIRAPYMVATENDSLNGAVMLFGYLLTNTAQIFADVRTYWSPESVERVTGHKLDRRSGRTAFSI